MRRILFALLVLLGGSGVANAQNSPAEICQAGLKAYAVGFEGRTDISTGFLVTYHRHVGPNAWDATPVGAKDDVAACTTVGLNEGQIFRLRLMDELDRNVVVDTLANCLAGAVVFGLIAERFPSAGFTDAQARELGGELGVATAEFEIVYSLPEDRIRRQMEAKVTQMDEAANLRILMDDSRRSCDVLGVHLGPLLDSYRASTGIVGM